MPLFHARRHAIVFVLAVLAVSVTYLAVQKPTYTALQNDEKIPYPFALQEVSPLLGSLTLIGFFNYPVWEASFDDGSISELMQGAVHEDKITFVVTPMGAGISVGAPLCKAITAGKRWFGYEYSDRPATHERKEAGIGPINNQFLPNNFIVSPEQRADGTMIPAYEAAHNVTFRNSCAVALKENARYVFIFNDPKITFDARNVEWCGNGFTQAPEECDDANLVDTDACISSCKFAACGDTFLQPLGADNQTGGGDDEQCDDGNTTNDDGCSALCLIEIPPSSSSSSSSATPICPNGIVEPPEECDDNNTVNTDQCTNVCTTARCGDAIMQPLGPDGIDQVPNGNSDDEECDDGNTVNTDSCDNACRLPPVPIPPASSSSAALSSSSSPMGYCCSASLQCVQGPGCTQTEAECLMFCN